MKLAFISVGANTSPAAVGSVYKGQNFRNVPGIRIPALTTFGGNSPVFG
jgi:hypothetical protein